MSSFQAKLAIAYQLLAERQYCILNRSSLCVGRWAGHNSRHTSHSRRQTAKQTNRSGFSPKIKFKAKGDENTIF